ncbi:helix-turn-helix transcriptional regulator [Paenibacillus chibensis]|uniref:helix-turn-helix transcriptional regulator n=1 Tax=Paenibacillus chibensis TaxID=59846 RepID=UPI000FDB1B3A|nr:DNA-binding protein [Paenibacillus chibensis]MEC0369334.1 DNA-binding protein [Paenibacillus chibensis]
MTRNDYPLVLQIKDVQGILGFSKSTTYEIAKAPDFPLIQINKRKIVYRDEFFSWLDSKREQAAAFN